MVNPILYSSKSENWETPQHLFDELDKEFHFTLDPCCTHENAKCAKHFTEKENGLEQSWKGERVFCNPPYGRKVSDWVRKCASGEADVAVLLVFSRTDTAWFHDYVYGKAELRFVKGRIKFGGSKNNAPAPSMIAIFRRVES